MQSPQEKAIRAALNKLRRNPVKELRRLGIKGYRFGPDSCPVNNYLTKVTRLRCISVNAEKIGYRSGRLSFVIRTPASVGNWINDFDSGAGKEFEAEMGPR